MDNYDLANFEANQGGNQQNPEDEPLKIDLGEDNAPPANGVSRKPLSLGGGGPAPSMPAASTSTAKPAPTPASAKPAPTKLSYTGPAPGEKSPGQKEGVHSGEGSQISGVKTFFTKLHHGSMVFLDEQITSWLNANPGVKVKQTNVTVGEVQAKKTEPNLIVQIWY